MALRFFLGQIGPVVTSIKDPSSEAFQYPVSNHPYYEQVLTFGAGVVADQATERHRGAWRTLFTDRLAFPNRALHVEIGCNGGHFLVARAQQNPECAFIGLDWKYKQIFRAGMKAKKYTSGNTTFLRARAERIGFMFGPGEIDFLYCLFPDPWPKNSDVEHRFITPDWLASVAPSVRPGGRFELRTDHPDNFDWMLKALRSPVSGWRIIDETRDLHAGKPNAADLKIGEVTLFERIYIRAGKPIHRVVAQRAF